MKCIINCIAFLCVFVLSSCEEEGIVEYLPMEVKFEPVLDSVLHWLPIGKHQSYLMTGQSGGKRTEELSLKMAESVKNHQQWFIQYSQSVEAGGVLPFHENLGLTQAEYDELFTSLDDIKLVSQGGQEIWIECMDGKIKFVADGAFEGLSYLSFDTRSLVAEINLMGEGNIPMYLSDTISVEGTSNPYGNPWHGYVWRFQEGEFPEGYSEFATANVKQFNFILGYVENLDKVILTLEIKILENGDQKADRTLPLLIDRPI